MTLVATGMPFTGIRPTLVCTARPSFGERETSFIATLLSSGMGMSGDKCDDITTTCLRGSSVDASLPAFGT